MEVSKDYISQLLGIIEEQKGLNNDLLRIIKKQELEIIKLKKDVDYYRIAYESLLLEVKELRLKVLEIDNLKLENKELREENKKLKGQLSKNSNNSSKPPSSNGFKSRHYSKKKKSDKKVGGQEGHEGSTLNRSTEVDEKVFHTPETCENCKYDLSKEKLCDTQEEYRQEIDIVVKKVIKNHHLGFKICPICGLKLSGKYPKNIKSNVQYGNSIKSFASYLSSSQLIPYDRLSKVFAELFKVKLSAGSLVTDFYAMYRKYPNIRNYFCNAHLLRELTYIHEIEGKYWAKRFMNTLIKLKNLDRTQNNFISQRNDLVSSLKLIIKNNLEIETRLQEENLRNLEEERLRKRLKKKKGKRAQTPAKNLLDRLDKYIDGYLRFAYDIRIPFTNNRGERDLRFVKVQQKISGTFRTLDGAKNFLKRASVISTFKKQKLNVLESLQDLLLGKTIAFEYQ